MPIAKIDELRNRIAAIESNLATLKQELERLPPNQKGYFQLKAIVDFSEAPLEQMRREFARLTDSQQR